MLQATALKGHDSTVSLQYESGVYDCIAECGLKLMQQYKVIMKLTSKEFHRWYRSLKELDEIMQMRASKEDITISVQGCSGTGNEMSKLRESEKPNEVVIVRPIEEQMDEMDTDIPMKCVVEHI